MSNSKKYNLFIMLSTIGRNIVEVFSSVLLYKMGYSFREILLFYIVLYFVGGIVSIGVIYLTRCISGKIILFISNFIFSFSFWFMSSMEKSSFNLFIFAIIYGIGAYSYHSLRHYFAIRSIRYDSRKDIGNILIFTNIGLVIGSIIASYITKKMSLSLLVIFVVFISCTATKYLFGIDTKDDKGVISYQRIGGNKILFFVLEQAKVIFLSLQPLYLYLFVSKSIGYVGIFNAITGISACIFIYFFVRKIDDKKWFKYLNVLFCLVLLLKINIVNRYLILVIGFFEGLFIKMFEIVSTENIYDIDGSIDKRGYVILVEVIFCFTRCLFCLICYFINDIRVILYMFILVIFGISFIKRKKIE